jgi:hypothetical protein
LIVVHQDTARRGYHCCQSIAVMGEIIHDHERGPEPGRFRHYGPEYGPGDVVMEVSP